MRAAKAVLSARSTICAYNRAAPCSPSSGARRVFTRPGTGARAKTISAASGSARVAPRKLIGLRTEEKSEAQAPHQDHGSQDPVPLPAPAGGGHFLVQCRRRAAALHRLAECDVLHQRDFRKAGKVGAAHEDRLIARSD